MQVLLTKIKVIIIVKGRRRRRKRKTLKKRKKESELVQLPYSLAIVNFGRQLMIDGLIAYLNKLKKLQHGSKMSEWINVFMIIVAQALSKQFLYNKCNRMRRGCISPSKTNVSMLTFCMVNFAKWIHVKFCSICTVLHFSITKWNSGMSIFGWTFSSIFLVIQLTCFLWYTELKKL